MADSCRCIPNVPQDFAVARYIDGRTEFGATIDDAAYSRLVENLTRAFEAGDGNFHVPRISEPIWRDNWVVEGRRGVYGYVPS